MSQAKSKPTMQIQHEASNHFSRRSAATGFSGVAVAMIAPANVPEPTKGIVVALAGASLIGRCRR